MVDRKFGIIQRQMQQLTVAQEKGNRKEEGNVCFDLGRTYHTLACSNCATYYFRDATDYFRKALSIFKEIGFRAGERKANCHLGITFKRMGKFKQAIECHKRNLTIAKEIGDRAEEGNALCNLGNACCGMGYFKLAIEYHSQDLSLAKELGDTAVEGRANRNLHHAHCMRKFKEAKECHENDRSFAKDLGDRAGEEKACGRREGETSLLSIIFSWLNRRLRRLRSVFALGSSRRSTGKA